MFQDGGMYMGVVNTKDEIVLINEETIKSKIYVVRGQKVMLDFDLAEMYGYETKRFNEQVKNNIEKFDEDFMFQLTKEEIEECSRSKNSTLNTRSERGQNIKYNPHAFTEQGIYMLMTVLKGELAIKQSKALIRTFKKMKDYIIQRQELIGEREYLQLSLQMTQNTLKNKALQSELEDIEDQMADVIECLSDMVSYSELAEYMNEFGEPHIKRGYLTFNGEPFKTDMIFEEIYSYARESIFIVDNYIGQKTLHLLIYSQKNVEIKLFSDNLSKEITQSVFDDFKKEYPRINIRLYQSGGNFHDRYIILDYGTEREKIFLCGASSKDGGRRISSILEDFDREKYYDMVDNLLNNPPLKLHS